MNTTPLDEVTKPKKNNKRLSVERIYQKKTQLEHIIHRPDSYIGSPEPCSQNMWVWDKEKQVIVSRNITYTPGFYKIFDEVIVNAADNKQRDSRMNSIKITIDQGKNIISVWNNGKGIPIEMHKEEKCYVPTLIFGHLLTSSNYDDSEKKVVGGRNGFGAKLCNIFSTKFTVETANGGKKFKQTWTKNMTKPGEFKIVDYSGTDFTCITFSPDLEKFKMQSLDDDSVALLMRRAYDMAGVCRGVHVTLNGEKIKIKTFKEYVELYLKGAALKKNSDEEIPRVVHEIVNPRWEICVTVSDSGFQQASFVNSIATTKGGTHINYLLDQMCEKLIATVKKKTGKGGLEIKPFQVKSHLWVFANTLIENPTFDSQTKENMTLRKERFGSKCELSPKYIKQVQDCGILDNIMSWVKFKTEAQLNKKTYATKHSRLRGIPKLDDANNAGTKNSRDCTLIVTEGDSAKALAMAGLGVVGRDKYGVFPLRGKLLNVRDATHKSIMDNAEIGNLLKIIGLQFGKKYETEGDMKSLRYGHLMIMADQDVDGSHIKGLVINFIHANWPSLLKLPFLEEFITPIVKVTKGSQSISLFSIPEFEEWKSNTPNFKSWRIKYYKGLGTSTSKEGKEYFSNMQRHRIVFEYDGPSNDQALVMAFSKKCINDRKNWLNNNMEERRLRKEAGLAEAYLYDKGTHSVTYRDFVNKELVLFSNYDNERSIPSLVDGLKPGQRKVLYTCMKRNDKHEVKVAQLAGSIAELSAYHHGEMSLMGTIINLAQNFVGSNNLNILVPHGQFGTRNLGGKDSASPRYICTMMSSLTRLLFPVPDDNVLTFLYEDNLKIEPEWYCPIIPMSLVNGADGIGTGYATKIPNFDVREIVENVKRMIAGEEPKPMIPSYKNFLGEINSSEPGKYTCSGTINVIDETTIEITELPIKTWTQSYKEQVMDVYLYGNEKIKSCITDYKEYHTDTTVKFVVTMTEEQLSQAEREGLHKKFKLDSSLHTTSMILFDEYGCLKKYDSPIDILKAYYKVRLTKYQERKEFLLGMLEAECAKLENQARFILEKIDGKVVIENRSKRDVVTTLVERGFRSDPVKAWKTQINRNEMNDDESDAPATDIASSTSTSSGGPDFAYLLSMAIMSLSKEKKEELLRQRDLKKEELEMLRKKTPSYLWMDDLNVFTEELERVEEQERADEKLSAELSKKGHSSKSARGKTSKPKKAVPSKDIKKAFEKKKTEPSKEAVQKVKEAFDFESDTKSDTASVASVESGSQEVEVLSLADRLKKNLGGGKKKQSTLNFDKPKNKKPAKVELSDSEDEIEAFSDDDVENLPKREARKRNEKKKYIESSDEDESKHDKDDDGEDDSFNPENDSDNGSDFTTSKSTKRPLVESDDSDNSDVAATRALIEKLSPMKKKQATEASTKLPKQAPKKKILSDEHATGSSDEPITLKDSPVKDTKKATKGKGKGKAAAAKTKKEDPKQAKINFGKGKSDEEKKKSPVKQKPSKSVAKRALSVSDDDSDEDVKVTKPKAKKAPSKSKAAAKPKKARKKFMGSDDDNDDESFTADPRESNLVDAPEPRARTGGRNAAKKKTYKFSSDEDDDDDFCL